MMGCFHLHISPFAFTRLSSGLRIDCQASCQSRERLPHYTLVVSNLQPALRPCRPSQNWFKIRHQQDTSRAAVRQWFINNPPARRWLFSGSSLVTSHVLVNEMPTLWKLALTQWKFHRRLIWIMLAQSKFSAWLLTNHLATSAEL